MSIIYKYPTNAALDLVIQEYVIDTSGFKGLEILPVEESYASKVQWDEKDFERGMTAPHLFGADPRIDLRPGSRLREYTPIPFKETDLVKEDEILLARQLGTINNTVNLNSLIAQIAQSRMDKTRIRQEWSIWQALKGRLIINENNVFVDETFPVQQYTPTTPWTDLQNSTPMRNLGAVKLMFRGKGATAEGAQIWMNSTTVQMMLDNQNPNDLKGMISNTQSVNFDLDALNALMKRRKLPEIVEYDEGYYDEQGNFKTFLEDGDFILVGKRPKGQKVGGWISTPSLHRTKNGMPAPGYFEIIEVNGKGGYEAGSISFIELGQNKNPKIELTGGIYGGPALRFGRSVIWGKVNLIKENDNGE